MAAPNKTANKTVVPDNLTMSQRYHRWGAKIHQACMAVALMALLSVSLGLDIL